MLQQALLPLVDYPTCISPDWWGNNLVTNNMVCAGGDGEKGGCSVRLSLFISIYTQSLNVVLV